MTVPDYQSLMLHVLRQARTGEPKISDVVEKLTDELGLSEEDRAELLPSGRQTTFANRVHWAKTYLKQAGLIETTRRAHFQITERGRSVLNSGVDRIDVSYLSQFPEFLKFRERRGSSDVEIVENSGVSEETATEDVTPDERMRQANRMIEDTLGAEILDRILNAPPSFFEKVVINLLLAMGYGGSARESGRAIGKSGDDGVDGVVDQDTLGLDRVYIQAKRYGLENSIGSGAIRDFFGSLDMHKAAKGIFVTTSTFTKSAMETADKLGKRIVLIDGRHLAQLMIRFNVGCRAEESFTIKKLDEEFFE